MHLDLGLVKGAQIVRPFRPSKKNPLMRAFFIQSQLHLAA